MDDNQYKKNKDKKSDEEFFSVFRYSTEDKSSVNKDEDKLSTAFNNEKVYTNRIHEKLETIFFRLDFIPSSDKLTSEIIDFISKEEKTEPNQWTRNPDKSLLAQLDGDSIAEMLGISLTDLYKYEIATFDGICLGKYRCAICVHRYFISLEIINADKEVKKEELENGNLIDVIYSFFFKIIRNDFFRVFELDIYFGLSYRAKQSIHEILKLIDDTAFPVLDNLNCRQDGLYRNITYKKDNPFVAIELIRSIKTIDEENTCVIVQSRAVAEINDKNTYFCTPYKEAEELLKKSTDSITRCFN